jgi:serine/threonine protein kinase
LSAELLASLRSAIEEGSGQALGSGYQAAVHRYCFPNRDLVVKTPHRSWLLGALWRHLIRREDAVYTRLAGTAGVPRSYGLIDGRYLALEYIAGPSLRDYETQLADREAFFAQLLQTLHAMHAAGVAHADRKRKDNIIVGAGERPYLIDFGIACRRSESALLNSLLFEPLRQMDYNAWIKLKYGRYIDPETATDVLEPADAALYRPLWIERLARPLRVAWQKVTLRRPRQRWRARRESRHDH